MASKLLVCVLGSGLVLSCTKERPSAQAVGSEVADATPVAPSPPHCPDAADSVEAPSGDRPWLADLVKRGLFVRNAKGEPIDAPAADLAVLARYPTLAEVGRLHDGMRTTILAASTRVRARDRVRVVHVLEVTKKGETLWVMGPKPIFDEYVDGALKTDPSPSWGSFQGGGAYDGMTLESPGADTNFEISEYTFDRPGFHAIQWRTARAPSNVLCIEVVP